jgi:ketosteroid isomerase-like protein
MNVSLRFLRTRARGAIRPAGWAAIVMAGASVSGCAGAADHPEIRSVLARQEQAWNRGDLDGFMAHYWKSDELVFRSPKGETHGWQAVLDRYRQAYPTKDAMGTLRFEVGKIAPSGQDSFEVAGQYRQEAAAGPQSGRFYLHFRKIGGEWVIVRDFTVGN